MKKMLGNRKWSRHYMNRKLLCFHVYDSNGVIKRDHLPLCIGVKDISYGGLGGMCKYKLEVSDRMMINLAIGDERHELTLQVKWIKYQVRYYDVGFAFVDLTEEKVLFLYRYINKFTKSKSRENGGQDA